MKPEAKATPNRGLTFLDWAGALRADDSLSPGLRESYRPGYVDVKGVSFATNTLTVNSQTAYCKGEYFRKELSVANRLHHTKKKANQKIKMNCSLCKYSGLTPSRRG